MGVGQIRGSIASNVHQKGLLVLTCHTYFKEWAPQYTSNIHQLSLSDFGSCQGSITINTFPIDCTAFINVPVHHSNGLVSLSFWLLENTSHHTITFSQLSWYSLCNNCPINSTTCKIFYSHALRPSHHISVASSNQLIKINQNKILLIQRSMVSNIRDTHLLFAYKSMFLHFHNTW